MSQENPVEEELNENEAREVVGGKRARMGPAVESLRLKRVEAGGTKKISRPGSALG